MDGMKISLLDNLDRFTRQAVGHYGNASQIDKAIEECDELSEALTRWVSAAGPPRGTRGHNHVIGEIADVLIMAQQMRLVFGAQAVDAMIDAKIERQRKRMQEGE